MDLQDMLQKLFEQNKQILDGQAEIKAELSGVRERLDMVEKRLDKIEERLAQIESDHVDETKYLLRAVNRIEKVFHPVVLKAAETVKVPD